MLFLFQLCCTWNLADSLARIPASRRALLALASPDMPSKAARKAKREAALLLRQQKAEFVGVDLPEDSLKLIVDYAMADRAECTQPSGYKQIDS